MTPQVQRLEGLLARVQRNRQQPRVKAVPAADPLEVALTDPEELELESLPPSMPPAAASPAQPAPSFKPAPSAPPGGVVEVVEPRRQPARNRVASPLEAAVEQQLQRPAPTSGSTERPPAAVPAPAPAPAAPTPAPAPVAAPAPVPAPAPVAAPPTPAPAGASSAVAGEATAAPRAIVAQPMAQPGRPVAQAVSPHPSSDEVPFGTLLRRTLSLRPR